MANRLAKETSPYLLQHAHNPVDWYPWGEEAIELARRERKPLLLSIGYSACHWCHVMERESFEDEETARLMNELFVNVKVDREERPDLDSIYMQAVQAMTGHGGWPMTTFLTPEMEPFWAGTYFPPDDRPGMPSFRRVLHAVSEAFRNRPDDVRRVAATMREMYRQTGYRAQRASVLGQETLSAAARGLITAYDARFGGFGDAPKFPQAMAMEFLLTHWARTGDRDSLDSVHNSFIRMARGGIYDQVGGGFARYSVDERWLVPHFEKMLYDNALLLRLGVHVWQATHDDEVRRVCEETLEWLSREMTAPSGAFYSTLDADSEGEEGKFYVWSEAKLRELLATRADAAIAHWGVSAEGNFEGHNILHVPGDGPRPAEIDEARKILYAARAKRVWPARDEKIIASWNGLMLRAVAEAARTFGDSRHRELALRNGEFLFQHLVRDGRAFRTHKDGVSRIPGFLEDHAAVALGALALYELTLDSRWLDRARTLADVIMRWFWDQQAATFYDTASDHEMLITRPRDITDNATPSGLSLALDLLLRLGDLLGDTAMAKRARDELGSLAEPMGRYPLAFGNALTAADMAVHGAVEVAIVGEARELSRTVAQRFVPSLILAGGAPGDIALLRDRPLRNGVATAYVCRNFVCDEPVTDSAALSRQLERVISPSSPASRP